MSSHSPLATNRSSAYSRIVASLVDPPIRAAGFGDGSAGLSTVQSAVADVHVAGAACHVTGTTALTSAGTGGWAVLTETMLGGLGARVVLAFVFGSFLAVIPLLMAIAAILGTFLLVWGVTTVADVSFIVEFLIALIGLGVSIDYSLLVVARWREERAAGRDNAAAVQRAMETAGRSVVFSGLTVAVGLLALIALPVPFLRSVGVGGMLIPLVTVAVAVTMLPVVLATVGPWLDWPRNRGGARVSRGWTAWARLVVRRRWLAAGAALVALGALLAAALALNPGTPQADALARTGDARDGLAALEQAGIGPGALTPIEVLVPGGDAQLIQERLARISAVRAVLAPANSSWRRGGTALITVIPTADGSSRAGRATLARVKQAAHAASGRARVGGAAAEGADFVAAVYGNFPLMVALIALATFVLLARAFRSLLLPLKAVLLNVLSVGGAWGVLVLVWQQGHGAKLIGGIDATGAITAWVPLMVFAFLFGLSMDYEVFILARMREEYDRTSSTTHAVIEGIGRTGRQVTGAAVILFLAFGALASGPETDIKILATGLAAGILLDATVIRALLVPALVSLLSHWNWWLPAVPARLLRVKPSPPHIEPAVPSLGSTPVES